MNNSLGRRPTNPADTPEIPPRRQSRNLLIAGHRTNRLPADRRFAEELAAMGCPVLNEVVLNQVLVSFGDADTTRRVIAALQREGTLWAGPTVWQGRTAMRLSVSSWATSDDDVTRSLAAIRRLIPSGASSP